MARTKSSKASTASASSGSRKPRGGAKRAHNMLKEMLSDVKAKLNAIGEVIANMPTHGDLHDEHIELAKSVKKLAKQTHSRVRDANEAAKKATR
jgi:phosphoketolase